MSTENNPIVEITETPVAKKAAAKKTTKPKVVADAANETTTTAPAKAKKSPAKKVVAAAKVEVSAPIIEVDKSVQNTAKIKPAVSAEERYQMIATAAYFLAHNRGFNGNYEMQDWITAEAQIDQQLKTAE